MEKDKITKNYLRKYRTYRSFYWMKNNAFFSK